MQLTLKVKEILQVRNRQTGYTIKKETVNFYGKNTHHTARERGGEMLKRKKGENVNETTSYFYQILSNSTCTYINSQIKCSIMKRKSFCFFFKSFMQFLAGESLIYKSNKLTIFMQENNK